MSRSPASVPGAATAVLLLHTLLVQLVTFLLRPATTYRAIEFGTPGAWLGVLSACFAFAPLLLALPSGALTDRLGERRMAIAGALLIIAAALVLAGPGGGLAGLVAGTVLLGLGHLCGVVAQQTLVANAPGRSGFDSAFGFYTFAASLGQALGPAVILAFGGSATVPRTHDIFVAGCAAGVVLVLLSFAFGSGGVRTAGSVDAADGGLRSLVRLPGLPRALLTSCVVLAAVDISLVYLPALGVERGIAASTIGLLLAIRAVSSMTTRFFLGRLTRLVGRRRLLVGGTLLAAAGLGALAVPMPLGAVAVLLCLAGLGLGAAQPITMSWLASSAPPGLRGRAMSLRLVGNRAGQVVFPSIAGAVAASAGAGGVLGATAAGLAGVAVAARTLPINDL